MNTSIKSALCVLAICLLFSCTDESKKNVALQPLIPQPDNVTLDSGSFILKSGSKIYFDGNQEIKGSADYLSNLLNPATDFDFEVIQSGSIKNKHFNLRLSPDKSDLGDEGYELEITRKRVVLTAYRSAGIFRGIQTIRQLLPPSIEQQGQYNEGLALPVIAIQDTPKYSYRGAMLDVSRHFFDVDEVKRYIDFLTLYKMNRLHLHLADDQGWRIEIKSWPNLTAHGGSTEVGGGTGGFYTQEQYKEIVQYASDRYITIIPEIDMPGHTNAALASYPELNCDGKAPELYTGTRVGFSSLCVDKELTYEFIDDVIREVAALTPGPYIHIGGDESHATEKADYLKFVNRVQGIVRSHGKEMIGWDETAQANLTSTSVTQLWANKEFALQAISKGAKLIMSPASRTYMDLKYDSTTVLGLTWAGYIEVDHGYSWDPAQYMEGVNEDNILGIEAPLWSETVTNMDEIEYMVFPRMPGYAELGWSGSGEWEAYRKRLPGHGVRWEVMDIDFYRSPKVDW